MKMSRILLVEDDETILFACVPLFSGRDMKYWLPAALPGQKNLREKILI